MSNLAVCHSDKPTYVKGLCKQCYGKQYRSANKAAAKSAHAAWREANRDEVNAKSKAWELANPEKVKETKRKYVSRNLNQYRAMCAKRHAAKLQRTPKWADLKAIKEFYLNCPPGFEVDHIVPLQGEIVSGFHVLGNLQYLTKQENASKGNKF